MKRETFLLPVRKMCKIYVNHYSLCDYL